MGTPLVYVVVLNWNGWHDTLVCLDALQHVAYPHQCVVVDNGSTDESVGQIQQAFPSVSLLTLGHNSGFAGGSNAGMRYALEQGADYVLLLNNDTIVAPDFLQPLITTLETNGTIAAVNPKIYYLAQPQTIWAVGGQISRWTTVCNNRGKGTIDQGQFQQQVPVDFATGCCILIRAKVLTEIGLFNEAYFAYYEDVDWSLRAIQAGYAMQYVPHSHIWHAVGASSKRQGDIHQEGVLAPNVYFLTTRNYLWFLRTHYKCTHIVLALGLFLFRYMFYYSAGFIIRHRWQKMRQLWAGFWVGLVQLPCPATCLQKEKFLCG